MLWVGNPTLEICSEGRFGELGIPLLRKNEIVEVIEALDAIISSEDV